MVHSRDDYDPCWLCGTMPTRPDKQAIGKFICASCHADRAAKTRQASRRLTTPPRLPAPAPTGTPPCWLCGTHFSPRRPEPSYSPLKGKHTCGTCFKLPTTDAMWNRDVRGAAALLALLGEAQPHKWTGVHLGLAQQAAEEAKIRAHMDTAPLIVGDSLSRFGWISRNTLRTARTTYADIHTRKFGGNRR